MTNWARGVEGRRSRAKEERRRVDAGFEYMLKGRVVELALRYGLPTGSEGQEICVRNINHLEELLHVKDGFLAVH